MQDESESYMKETFPLISNENKDLLLYKKLLFFSKKERKMGKRRVEQMKASLVRNNECTTIDSACLVKTISFQTQ